MSPLNQDLTSTLAQTAGEESLLLTGADQVVSIAAGTVWIEEVGAAAWREVYTPGGTAAADLTAEIVPGLLLKSGPKPELPHLLEPGFPALIPALM